MCHSLQPVDNSCLWTEKEDLTVTTMVTFFISPDSGCCHPASIPQGQGRNWLCAECQVCLGLRGTVNRSFDQSKVTFTFCTDTNNKTLFLTVVPKSQDQYFMTNCETLYDIKRHTYKANGIIRHCIVLYNSMQHQQPLQMHCCHHKHEDQQQ